SSSSTVVPERRNGTSLRLGNSPFESKASRMFMFFFFFFSTSSLILDCNGSVRCHLDVSGIHDPCIKYRRSLDRFGELEFTHNGPNSRICSVARQQASTITFVVAPDLESIDQLARNGRAVHSRVGRVHDVVRSATLWMDLVEFSLQIRAIVAQRLLEDLH